MDAYLIDTSILTVFLDPKHPRHQEVVAAVDAIAPESPRYVSVVGLAELMFGVELAVSIARGDIPVLRDKVDRAQQHAILDISRHTSRAYAEIKAKLAIKFLASTLRRDRPTFLQDWVDQANGRSLGIDENDLWMCAQAKEREIIFVTADRRISRIPEADPDVQVLIV